MMILSAAVLLAVSAGCVAWYYLNTREIRATVSTRLSALPQNLSFPYSLNPSEQAASQNGNTLTLEASFESKLARKLYLAGLRSKNAAFRFQWLERSVFIIPGLMIFLGIMTGSVDVSLFMRAGGIGFALFFFTKGSLSGRCSDFCF